MTYPYAGSFGIAGTGVDGVTVSAWDASRFGSAPALNDDPPDGDADATTTTTTDAGFDGAYVLELPSTDQYYVLAVYEGVNYWQGPVAGAGVGGGAGLGSVLDQVSYGPAPVGCGYAAEYFAGTALAALDPTNLTTSFVAPVSGAVRVQASFTWLLQTGAAESEFAASFVTHDTSDQVAPLIVFATNPNNDTVMGPGFATVDTIVTGLTPGDTYDWDLAALATSDLTANPEIAAGDGSTLSAGPPILITVYAA